MHKYHPFALTAMALSVINPVYSQINPHPNVILIITDDQGYGDLGINGNTIVQTPAIDQLAKESVRFNNFYVSPVCAPTRSSLMTGRYSLRTGIRDTYNGGAIMAASEITLAEMLKQASYSTGIFGKWHLGDSYPSRPVDQGFDESVVHLSGGMGQAGDFTTYFKGDSSYFNPVLWHNGRRESYRGYCSDLFTTQAIDFIEHQQNSPFFCYLSFNAPHTPLQVPDPYYQKYKNTDPAVSNGYTNRPSPKMSEKEKGDARKVYAMVTNIDENIGRLLRKLDELKIRDNTIVIFMTDNGPQQSRYNAGMRGLKGSVYRGGVRVPFYLRYPALFKGDKEVEATAAHIDVLPTLSVLCNVELPGGRVIDGKNLLPVITKDSKAWSDERTLFFYWTRRYPELYNNMALQKGEYKLIGHTGYNSKTEEFELYNIKTDPYEQQNVVKSNRTAANDLRDQLELLTKELTSSENLIHPPRIIIGSDQENPVFLNRNDADGQPGIWAQEEIYGLWKVSVRKGSYNIRFKFMNPVKANGQMCLETKTVIRQMKNQQPDSDTVEMKNVYLPEMDCDFIPYYMMGTKRIFPFLVEIERI